jgi:DNA repair exonuclease SbcCD ATPase subunit
LRGVDNVYWLRDFRAKNFTGIYNGLGRKEIYLNFANMLDKKIILILGANKSGKTTLGTIMHPLSGTTDRRNKYIRKGKDGEKELNYIDENNVEINIKHIYTAKGDTHSIKSFITKTIDGNVIELNPNGNVTSFESMVEAEFGLDKDFLKIMSHNDDMKGLVGMTPGDRKKSMAKITKGTDEFLLALKVLNTKHRDLRVTINSLVDKIGKLQNEESLNLNLQNTENKISVICDRRDSIIGKLHTNESTLLQLDEFGDISSLYKEIRKEVNTKSASIEKLMKDLNKEIDKLDKLDITKSSSYDDIKHVLEKAESKIVDLDTKIFVLNAKIPSDKKSRKKFETELEEKESLLDGVSDSSLSDLEEVLDTYTTKYKKLDKLMSKLDTNLTKSDLLVGYEIVDTVRNYIGICHNNSDGDIEKAIAAVMDNPDEYKNELLKLDEKCTKIREANDKLVYELSKLTQYSEMSKTLEKRPSTCKIDNCPFIESALQWNHIKDDIIKLTEKLENNNIKYDSLLDEVDDADTICVAVDNILAACNFIKMNKAIIDKLPNNSDYKNKKALLESIRTGNLLTDADDFEGFIDILEQKDEYDQLRYVKIPRVENEINMMTTQGKFILNTKEDIKKLKKDISKLNSDISEDEDNLDSYETKLDILKADRTTAYDIIDIHDEMNETKSGVDELTTKFMKIKDDIVKIENVKTKIDELNDELKDMEKELRPLTKDRDLYKHGLIKLKEYKSELALIKASFDFISKLREAPTAMALILVSLYMEDIRMNANALLSTTFNGSLYLEDFIIDDKEFTIPYQTNGDLSPDISYSSSSEESFINICLALSIAEQLITNYGVLLLDEVDKGLSAYNKSIFIDIIHEQIKRVGINQTFMISHSPSFYEKYDVGYILFPGYELKDFGEDDAIII